MKVLAHVLTLEAEAVWGLSEQKERSALSRMCGDGAVPARQLHVTDLAFPEILKHPVRAAAIRVAVFKPLFTCYDDHERMLSGRDDAALLLPTKSRVNVGSTVIYAAAFEAPGQFSLANGSDVRESSRGGLHKR